MKLNFRRDRLFLTSLFIAVQFAFGLALSAQNVDRISKREVERRQPALLRGAAALAQAQAAMQVRDYTLAHDEFRIALNSLPDPVTSASAPQVALAGLGETGRKVR